jgi:hypothetical protein
MTEHVEQLTDQQRQLLVRLLIEATIRDAAEANALLAILTGCDTIVRVYRAYPPRRGP